MVCVVDYVYFYIFFKEMGMFNDFVVKCNLFIGFIIYEVVIYVVVVEVLEFVVFYMYFVYFVIGRESII